MFTTRYSIHVFPTLCSQKTSSYTPVYICTLKCFIVTIAVFIYTLGVLPSNDQPDHYFLFNFASDKQGQNHITTLDFHKIVIMVNNNNTVTVNNKSNMCTLFPPSDADLNIAQTAWGDSGVYVCSVVSSQDLTGNGQDYTELIVLGKHPFMPGVGSDSLNCTQFPACCLLYASSSLLLCRS